LGEVLFDELKLNVKGLKKTAGGARSTRESELLKLSEEHEIVKLILNYRELAKLLSTYIDAIPKLVDQRHRLHTYLNQAGAVTGRMSSTNPNLQNIPARDGLGIKIREAFMATPGYEFIAADYSQIELRVLAILAKEEALIKIFNEGKDVHASVASLVFGVPEAEVTKDMRRKAKVINFGIIYGISAFGLAQRLGISRTDAGNLIEQYFEKYSGIKRYMDNTINFAREHGYVETLLNRRRYLRDINAGNWTIRGFAERNAINAPIQGSAADMIKVAMINIHKQLKAHQLQSKMILQVHDELLFDVYIPEKEEIKKIVLEEMQNALPLRVPVEVSAGFGANWLEAH